MKDYREDRISSTQLYEQYNGRLSKFLKDIIKLNERVISVVCEYNSYGSVYAYIVYIEIDNDSEQR